ETASEGLLLSLFEGQEIEFRTENSDSGEERIVRGKIIRSGYSPGVPGYDNRYVSKSENGPIIEVDGKMRFTLPGEPIFPSLGDDSILRPRLSWKLTSDRAASFNAELGYITGGLSWSAAY